MEHREVKQQADPSVYAVFAQLSNGEEAFLAMGPTVWDADAFANPVLNHLRQTRGIKAIEVRQWFDLIEGGYWRTIITRVRKGRPPTVEDHGYVAA